MMLRFLKTICLTGSVGILAACGGGGSSNDSGSEGSGSSGGGSAGPVTTGSPVGGTGSASNNAYVWSGSVNLTGKSYFILNTGAIGITDVDALLDVNTGALSATAGGLSINASGFTSFDGTTFTYDDGTTEVTDTPVGDFTDFITGTDSDAYVQGYAGLATQSSHMPTGGTASYSGVGTVLYATNTSAELFLANSQIDVNFGAATVDAELVKTSTLSGSGATFDTVTVDGASVSGANFSGGNFSYTNAGTAVNATGAGTVSKVEGTFYGWDDSLGAPDEVAGVGVASGSTGSVFFDFFGD